MCEKERKGKERKGKERIACQEEGSHPCYFTLVGGWRGAEVSRTADGGQMGGRRWAEGTLNL